MIQVILIVSFLFGQPYGDGYSYYNIISENNLFRPLGWTKPDPTPKYELMATIISETYTRAYIRDVRYGRDYFVGIGDNIGDNNVQKIIRGMVELGNGKKIKGESFGFIATDVRKGTKTNQKKGRGKSTSSGTGTKITKTKEDTGVRQRTSSRGRTGNVDWQAQIQRFQNASPEERQSMIEQFRAMRGNRGGGSRGRRRNR